MFFARAATLSVILNIKRSSVWINTCEDGFVLVKIKLIAMSREQCTIYQKVPKIRRKKYLFKKFSLYENKVYHD